VVDVDTGERTTVSGIATAGGNYAVSRLQVPRTALAGAVAEPPTTDRGPWPLWSRLATAVALAAVTGRVAGGVVARVRRRRQRLRAVAPRAPAGRQPMTS
jgi:ABC-type branched-subunit amino acid transport system permease subunit